MKKYLFFLVALAFFSCDKEKIKSIELKEIEAHKSFIGVGQKINLSCDALNVDESTVTYEWYAGDNLFSTDRIALWIPEKVGDIYISLIVADKNGHKNANKMFNVLPCDYRNGLWTDSKEDVKENEEITPENEYTEDGEMLLYYTDVINSYMVDGYRYVFNLNNKLISGLDVYLRNYNISPSLWYTEYQLKKDYFEEKYGYPTSYTFYWAANTPIGIKNNPDNYGYAIREGYLEIVTSYESNRTTATLLITKGDNYVIFGIIAEKSDNLKKSASLKEILEKFNNQIKCHTPSLK